MELSRVPLPPRARFRFRFGFRLSLRPASATATAIARPPLCCFGRNLTGRPPCYGAATGSATATESPTAAAATATNSIPLPTPIPLPPWIPRRLPIPVPMPMRSWYHWNRHRFRDQADPVPTLPTEADSATRSRCGALPPLEPPSFPRPKPMPAPLPPPPPSATDAGSDAGPTTTGTAIVSRPTPMPVPTRPRPRHHFRDLCLADSDSTTDSTPIAFAFGVHSASGFLRFPPLLTERGSVRVQFVSGPERGVALELVGGDSGAIDLSGSDSDLLTGEPSSVESQDSTGNTMVLRERLGRGIWGRSTADGGRGDRRLLCRARCRACGRGRTRRARGYETQRST